MLEEVRAEIRSVLLSSPNKLSLEQFEKDYRVGMDLKRIELVNQHLFLLTGTNRRENSVRQAWFSQTNRLFEINA